MEELSNLIGNCVQRNISAKVFHSLLSDFSASSQVSMQDVVTQFATMKLRPLHAEYLVEICQDQAVFNEFLKQANGFLSLHIVMTVFNHVLLDCKKKQLPWPVQFDVLAKHVSDPRLTKNLGITESETIVLKKNETVKHIKRDPLFRNMDLCFKIFNWQAMELSRDDDLLNLAFVNCAQFLNCKSGRGTVLDNQWYIFITKQLPLLLSEFPDTNVAAAFKAVDDKIMNVVSQGWPLKDARSEFVKSCLNLSLVNSTDDLWNGTHLSEEAHGSGVKVHSVNELQSILSSWEFEPLFFWDSSPTYIRDLSNIIAQFFTDCTKNNDYKNLSKLCVLMASQLDQLMTVCTFIGPHTILTLISDYLEQWQVNENGVTDEFDTEERVGSFIDFSRILLLYIVISKKFNIVPRETNSWCYKYLISLGSCELPTECSADVEIWVRDLFVNGLISDDLMKHSKPKEIIQLLPFIFKQTMLAYESGILTDLQVVCGGIEYLLQPFLVGSLIKICYWLADHLASEKPSNLLGGIMKISSCILKPQSLTPEIKLVHEVIMTLCNIHDDVTIPLKKNDIQTKLPEDLLLTCDLEAMSSLIKVCGGPKPFLKDVYQNIKNNGSSFTQLVYFVVLHDVGLYGKQACLELFEETPSERVDDASNLSMGNDTMNPEEVDEDIDMLFDGDLPDFFTAQDKADAPAAKSVQIPTCFLSVIKSQEKDAFYEQVVQVLKEL